MNGLQGGGDTFLPLRPKTIDIGAADHGALRPQGHGFQHVLAGANAAVHPNFHLVPHGVHDGWKRADGGQRAVQLPPAVVGHDDGIRPHAHGHLRVFHIQDAFQNHLAVPLRDQPFDGLPIQRRVKLFCRPCPQV